MDSETSNIEGVTSQLCKWIESLKLEDIPDTVRTRAKYLILDGIGCALVGAKVPWSSAAFDAFTGFDDPGRHVIIGYKTRLGAMAAATLNGTWIQACELDDYHSTAPLHGLAVIIPSLFAATVSFNHQETKTRAITGKDFLVAAIVGFEVGPRVGMALQGTEVLAKGWHCGAIFGAPAAAASSSKLLNLPTSQIEDAIGIACTQAGGLMAAQYGGMVKRMHHGFAARNGFVGTMLAYRGFQGIKQVFERPYGGFLTMFGLGSKYTPATRPDEIVEGLGYFWHTEECIRLKLHACCGGIHGTIECLAEMQELYPARLCGLDNLCLIKSIHIQLGEAVFHHCGWTPKERPLDATGAQMNAAYIAATQLVDRQVLLAQFVPAKLDREEIWNLVYKTQCSHDAMLDQPNTGCGAMIKIVFDDGTEIEHTLLRPKGVEEPIRNSEILDKFRRLTSNLISVDLRAQIEHAVLGMEEMTDVEDLINLLAVDVPNSLE